MSHVIRVLYLLCSLHCTISSECSKCETFRSLLASHQTIYTQVRSSHDVFICYWVSHKPKSVVICVHVNMKSCVRVVDVSICLKCCLIVQFMSLSQWIINHQQMPVKLIAARSQNGPRVGPGHPSFPLVHLLHLFPFLLFPFFRWLYPFSSFVHPFPFYQNSPTPFPGRRL